MARNIGTAILTTMVWEKRTMWTAAWKNPIGGRRGGNRNPIPYVRPLIWSLVRLCVDSIDTSHNITVRLSFKWIFNMMMMIKGFAKSVLYSYAMHVKTVDAKTVNSRTTIFTHIIRLQGIQFSVCC